MTLEKSFSTLLNKTRKVKINAKNKTTDIKTTKTKTTDI